MSIKHVYILFFIYGLNVVHAQTENDSIPRLDLVQIAHINQSDSYITFPIDIGNIEPLLFEANINPNFVIRKRSDSKIMMVLTPQITIRMYNEESYPVKTPSYIPQISFYYLMGYPELSHHTTLFGRIAHHSNGQDGSFYIGSNLLEIDNPEINLQSGNFATNFFEVGFIDTSYGKRINAVKFFKSSVEIHPKSWMLKEMKGGYSGFRWHNSFFAYKLPMDRDFFSRKRKANFSMKVETTWMLDQINDWSTFDLNRFSGSLTFYYHPKFLEDIGFFIQLYHGRDYYNIYFEHQLDIIRFGLMTEIMRF